MTVTFDTPPRTIVTGFGPFGDHDYNPSADAADALADELGTDAHLLSVTYRKAARFAPGRLRTTDGPLRFVHLGLGANRSEVCFENCAHNRRDDRPDENERKRNLDPADEQRLVDEDKTRRQSVVDVSKLVELFNRNRLSDLPEARLSRDCGAYVCNALYYHSLRNCRRHRESGHLAEALFVHIPRLDSERARRLGRLLAPVVS